MNSTSSKTYEKKGSNLEELEECIIEKKPPKRKIIRKNSFLNQSFQKDAKKLEYLNKEMSQCTIKNIDVEVEEIIIENNGKIIKKINDKYYFFYNSNIYEKEINDDELNFVVEEVVKKEKLGDFLEDCEEKNVQGNIELEEIYVNLKKFINEQSKKEISCISPKSLDTLEILKNMCREWIIELSKETLTKTKPASVSYLFFGERISEQSLNIKLGKFGEFMVIQLVKFNKKLELLKCGIHSDVFKGKKKDIDLLFRDTEKKIIYYRELKANIELDSEKAPATINKILDIKSYLVLKYPEYQTDIGLLHWTLYDRCELIKGTHNVRKCEEAGIKFDNFGNFLEIINFVWDKEDFYKFFRELGEILN